MKFFSSLLVTYALIFSSSSAQAKPAPEVQLETYLPDRRFVSGAPLDAQLVVKNPSHHVAELKFSPARHFEVQVFRVNNKQRHLIWSAKKPFSVPDSSLRLDAGGVQTFQMQLLEAGSAPLLPGRYEVRSKLTGSPTASAPPIGFSVEKQLVWFDFDGTASRGQVGLTKTITFPIAVKNRTGQKQILTFKGGQSFDVFVSNEAGRVVWSWGATKDFGGGRRRVMLQPNQKLLFQAFCQGRELEIPGKYTVQAVLRSSPRLYSRKVPIEIK